MTIAAIVSVPLCIAAPACAVAPPPIDDSRLPKADPARPPTPTVQRDICAMPSLDRAAATSQLSGLDLQQAWGLSRGAGQRVAVIDTGVAPHPRLPRLVAGGDYVSTGDGLQDCDGHGTAVAGIIAATAESHRADAFSGVAPEAGLISIRQSSTRFGAARDSAASGFGDVDTMARAVRTAADMGASVINISSVACARDDATLDDRPLGAALAYAVDIKNAVVVTAAGNAGAGQCAADTTVVSPAWYDEFVLTVGSVDANGEPSSFTLAGPWVDVAAPGEGVISLSISGNGLANTVAGKHSSTALVGTSFAAPVVSGLAALIRSRFPTWTARQVMQRIKTTAQHPPGGWNPRVGAGVVDVLAAVSTDTPAPSASPTSRPVATPRPPQSPDHRPRNTALVGAAICGIGFAAMLTGGLIRGRLRRRNIPCD
ncbi:type VII secretion-associated serine protease mycosin [Candidatus Mycobacterium wuenschmannii]|uniref:Type VII secretion-associated serine protease mycosin n=1 Tax=Candidatus Mycobacterium wuenschmannii TaxID=3027808 RepID=A0ABY8VVG3_9MYCO|nr:type VII secretion-associated serine protease mycosin [Candidatus Mycobacterium wuenschmannii]WIM87634.1 type VII secretion-associated serine protease mycosin [Candidatus Mycobacterium wuenschmannii]